jgi:hypothetical protein
MYDLLEVRTYRPKGDYTIDSKAYIDCGKEQLVAALGAEESASRRNNDAKWLSIVVWFAKLFVPARRTTSEGRAVSQ